jgi:NAD(P)-dependent dehydrogenase (short-subunit alcohol dehydrogenase family)
MSPFNARTTSEDVITELKERLTGKNVVVTGVSPGGLGTEVVRAIAPHANLIYVTGRDKDRILQSVDSIKKDVPTANIVPVVVDLTSFESIRKGAAEITEPVHLLINNAATAQFETLTRTKEGFEAQFGGNHLGHFLFTNLILPRLREAATPEYPARVVIVSSFVYSFGKTPGGFRWDDPGFSKRPEEYNKFEGYILSKTANLLHARAIANKFKKDNILAYSLSPGIVETNMNLAVPFEERVAFGFLNEDGSKSDNPHWKTMSEGAATELTAALDPSLVPHNGAFLVDSQPLPADQLSPLVTDESAERLWKLSEELLAPFQG